MHGSLLADSTDSPVTGTIRDGEGYAESAGSPTRGHTAATSAVPTGLEQAPRANRRGWNGTSRLEPVVFDGPAGRLEGIWKHPAGRPVGGAVFAHPLPTHGGTLHSKVVYRAARALAAAGYDTLRFNFRGVGASEGTWDSGRGETEDFRAALAEAQRRAGLPLLAGGFSFGAGVALRAIEGDPRVAAFVGVGLPLATASGKGVPRPEVPSLFVVGERDTFGPPEWLRDFLGGTAEVVEVAGADHFFDGKLDELERAIAAFLARLPREAAR